MHNWRLRKMVVESLYLDGSKQQVTLVAVSDMWKLRCMLPKHMRMETTSRSRELTSAGQWSVP